MMSRPTEEQLKTWKSQYGEIYELTGEADDDDRGNTDKEPAYYFIFRKPGRAALSRFAKQVMSDALKAMYNLVFDCLLFPDQDEVRKLFDEKPGMAISVGSELQKIVGTNQDFFVKRL